MPELPEVERGRALAEAVARGRRIERLRCAADEIVYGGRSPRAWHRALRGSRVTDVARRGKYLWFVLDTRPWPLFHFGMTGGFRVPDAAPLRLAADGKRPLDRAWPPRFTKLHLYLEGGAELVFTNSRRLGRLRLLRDPPSEPPVSTLGFDPLLDLPGPAAFVAALGRRHTPLKALLLDQGFAAGVGNWIADEVLYQAKLDPRRRAATLSEAEARRLRAKLRHVITRAVAVDADKSRFPRTWLFHHRWGKVDGARTARGERIEHLTVAGRTTAWVPSVQK